MRDALRAHVRDEADGVLRQLGAAPVADRRLHERLVRVRRGRLELRAADDDAVVVLADDPKQHVRILILRSLRAVALRVGVRRHVERVADLGAPDVRADVLRELRIDLVQHVLTVEERPHLADRLVADAGHDAADVVEHRVDRASLGVPVGLRQRQLRADRAALARPLVDVRHDVARRRLVRHVVDARPGVDDRPEGRVRRDVRDALAVDPDLAPVADRLAVLVAGPDHRRAPRLVSPRPATGSSRTSVCASVARLPRGETGAQRNLIRP